MLLLQFLRYEIINRVADCEQLMNVMIINFIINKFFGLRNKNPGGWIQKTNFLTVPPKA